MTVDTLAHWHRLVEDRTMGDIDTLLTEDAVFYSPVVHTPQRGKAITAQYLKSAFDVLFNDTFRYIGETVGSHNAVLEFAVEIDGIAINGVDMICWNDEGLIVEFKVMLRPLKAIQLVHQHMGTMLQAHQSKNQGQKGD